MPDKETAKGSRRTPFRRSAPTLRVLLTGCCNLSPSAGDGQVRRRPVVAAVGRAAWDVSGSSLRRLQPAAVPRGGGTNGSEPADVCYRSAARLSELNLPARCAQCRARFSGVSPPCLSLGIEDMCD